MAVPGIMFGLVCLLWGAKKIPGQKEVVEAYQIVAPGAKPEDWLVVGSIPEVTGFMEGVKAELKQKEAGQAVET